MGMIGGYIWSVVLDTSLKIITIDNYLFVSASRSIQLPGGLAAAVKLSTEMPWTGRAVWTFNAPDDWTWRVRVPKPDYAANLQVIPRKCLRINSLSDVQ